MIHVAVHGLQLVLALALDDTASDIPLDLEVVALRGVDLRVGSALGILGVVGYFHGGSTGPVAGIHTLVESASVHAESLAHDRRTLLLGGIAEAASSKGQLITAALALAVVNHVASCAALDLAMCWIRGFIIHIIITFIIVIVVICGGLGWLRGSGASGRSAVLAVTAGGGLSLPRTSRRLSRLLG